jgi:hypothetical protein
MKAQLLIIAFKTIACKNASRVKKMEDEAQKMNDKLAKLRRVP